MIYIENISLGLINIIINIFFQMGKFIRTIRNAVPMPPHSKEPIHHPINKNELSKNINSRLMKTKAPHSQRKVKFIARIKNGSFGEIVQKTQFECPICLEIFVSPVLRKCGHIYCYRCMETQKAYHNSCCVCRSQQEESLLIPSKLTQILIKDYILPKEIELYKYLCRSTDSQEWAKRRKLSHVQVGMKVDLKDFTNVWRGGVVVNTFVAAYNKKKMASIKINIHGEDYIEAVNFSSNRLANSNFFTKKEYLQDFSPVFPVLKASDSSENQIQFLECRPDLQEQEFFSFQIDTVEGDTRPSEQIWMGNIEDRRNSQNAVQDALNVLQHQEYYLMI